MKSHKALRRGLLSTSLAWGLMLGVLPASSHAATLVVTSAADPGVGGCTASGSGDGCTLREAIVAANNQTLTPGDDTINASGISGTITLVTALPALNTNMVISGPGAASLTVQRSTAAGTAEFRLFTVDNTTTTGPTIVISGFTLSNGKVSGTDNHLSSGGGIYNNHGTLTISNCAFKGNSATNGGAIGNDGSLSVSATLALSNSTLTANIASAGGGALFNNGSGGGSAPLSISTCTFTGNKAINGGAILNDGHQGGSATITALSGSVLSTNTATGDGGGIQNDGSAGGSATLVMSDTTLSANHAVDGGGINNDGTSGSATQAILTSTFSANAASGNGGAINNDGRSAGSATLTAGNSTFSGNTAGTRGGAILNLGTGGSATVEIDNTTVYANVASSSSSAAIDSDGTAGNATLALGSTILSNTPSKNVLLTVNSETTFTSKNNNLCSDAAGGDNTTAPGGPYFSAGSDIRNTNPKLDTQGLKDNGGPTRTVALLLGSPAIDKAAAAGSPTQDQRGYDRVGIADIGAFEYGAVPPGTTLSVVEKTPFTDQKLLISAFKAGSVSGTATSNANVVSVQMKLSRLRNGVSQIWNGTSFTTTSARIPATLSGSGITRNWVIDKLFPAQNLLDEGQYIILINATDAAGAAASVTTRVTLFASDTELPVASILTPTLNQKVLISGFGTNAITGTATDNIGVMGVKVKLSRKRGTTNYYWNGSAFTTAAALLNATVIPVGGSSVKWNLNSQMPPASQLDTGLYQLEAYAVDVANGKSTTIVRPFTLGTDFSAPAVVISSPTASQRIEISTFGAGTVKGTATDNRGVTSVQVKLQRLRGSTTTYWNGSAFTTTVATVEAKVTTAGGSSVTWSFDSKVPTPATGLDTGTYTLYATAFDAAGNTTTSASRAFTIAAPATAPSAVATGSSGASS